MRIIKAMRRMFAFRGRSSVSAAGEAGEGGDSLLLFDEGGITFLHLGMI